MRIRTNWFQCNVNVRKTSSMLIHNGEIRIVALLNSVKNNIFTWALMQIKNRKKYEVI